MFTGAKKKGTSEIPIQDTLHTDSTSASCLSNPVKGAFITGSSYDSPGWSWI